MRLIRLIIMMAVFVGGYYLGRQPNSPDIIAWGRGACQRISHVVGDVSQRAQKDNIPVHKAAFSYLLDDSPKTVAPEAE
jgi:hypothetical protein